MSVIDTTHEAIFCKTVVTKSAQSGPLVYRTGRRPRKAANQPASGQCFCDQFWRMPPYLWPHRNGMRWSKADMAFLHRRPCSMKSVLLPGTSCLNAKQRLRRIRQGFTTVRLWRHGYKLQLPLSANIPRELANSQRPFNLLALVGEAAGFARRF